MTRDHRVWLAITLATGLAAALTTMPAAARANSGATPVACDSAQRLWAYLDAADQRDRAAMGQLLDNGCIRLGTARFLIVGERNGVTTIRLFDKPGDWRTSHLAYTLDEMATRAPGRNS